MLHPADAPFVHLPREHGGIQINEHWHDERPQDRSLAPASVRQRRPRAPLLSPRISPVYDIYCPHMATRLRTAPPAHQMEVDPWPSPLAPAHPSSPPPLATSHHPPSKQWMPPLPTSRLRKTPGSRFPSVSASLCLTASFATATLSLRAGSPPAP